MSEIKLATFNVEWMTSIFGAKHNDWDGTIPGAFQASTWATSRLILSQTCQRFAGASPGSSKKWTRRSLASRKGRRAKSRWNSSSGTCLADDYVVYKSPANPVWQSVYALVRRSIAPKVTEWKPKGADTPALWKDIPYYPWGQITAESRKEHDFARQPLLLECTPEAGKSFKFTVLHTKSKFSKLKTRKQWDERHADAVLDALNARVKLSAEIVALRKVLNEFAVGVPIVITGDLNDGAFADLMEEEFLIHNIIDEVAGSLLHPETYFEHAMDPNVLADAVTVSFPDPLNDGAITHELIDHVLVSKAIWSAKAPFGVKPNSCVVEHDAYDHHNDEPPDHPARGLRPSDHRPVTVTLEY